MVDAGKYGPRAVIAGGSEGIGRCIALDLAKDGINCVLTARKPGPLEEAAAEVRAATGVEVRTLALDLTAPDMLGKVRAATDDPDAEVKKKAVFALSQIPNGEGVPDLIQVAQENKSREVRKQAMFWLGQSRDARAVEFFAEILK